VGFGKQRVRIGSLRLADGAVKGAVAAAEHALELSPGDSQACQVLASAYERLGRHAEARDMAARARAAGLGTLPWPGAAQSSGAQAKLPAAARSRRCWPATGASTRGARARRNYDRVMSYLPDQAVPPSGCSRGDSHRPEGPGSAS
jgi:hypothetical protein